MRNTGQSSDATWIDNDTTQRLLARARSITLPQGGDHYVAVGPQRPCVTILVHGVNDLAGVYADIEQGLCDGLNERLDLLTPGKRTGDNPGRLMAATYTSPADDQGKAPNPDAVYFRRRFESTRRGDQQCGIVVPFYWGFREEEAAIQKDTPHGEWLDRYGNRLDKAGTKEGGAFANATTNLPDMWSQGFSGKLIGVLGADKMAGTPTHPLLPAPSRRYMVLAAQRLAMLIRIIRKRYPNDTINLVGHSQGTLISLLAHAMLKDQQKDDPAAVPADCMVMLNSPYSLNEPLNEYLQVWSDQQTREARLATLSGIIQFITAKPNASVSLADMAGNNVATRVGGAGWNGSTCQTTIRGEPVQVTERDNRATVCLYFTPQDQTVALSNVQGIGWQGVPDQVAGQTALTALGGAFYQRIFTPRRRDGEPEKVGARPAGYRYELLRKGEKTWENAGLSFMDRQSRADFSEGQHVTLTAPPLPRPIEADLSAHANVVAMGKSSGLYSAQAPLDPIDARIAITRDGGWKPGQNPRTEEVPKSIAYARGTRLVDITEALNNGKESADCTQVVGVKSLDGERVLVTRGETPNEAAARWMQTNEPVSFHSAIPANPWHSQAVLAYDVAIGPTQSVRDEAFYAYLCRVADWRLGWDNSYSNGRSGLKIESVDTGPDKEVLKIYREEDEGNKGLINATVSYRTTGRPIGHMDVDMPTLVVSQTKSERDRKLPLRNGGKSVEPVS